VIGPLQRAMAEGCLGASAGAAISDDLRAFLSAHGVAAEDADAILRGAPRLAVYRSLVRNGLSDVVSRMMPSTRARMNRACTGRFDADFATFVDSVGPRTHFVRDVPAELFAWAEPRWRSDPEVPAYLPDLASFELARFAIASAPAREGPALATEHALTPRGDIIKQMHAAISGDPARYQIVRPGQPLPADPLGRRADRDWPCGQQGPLRRAQGRVLRRRGDSHGPRVPRAHRCPQRRSRPRRRHRGVGHPA
jgi:hypothetical protein